MQPPFLASQTPARMAPAEPWAKTLTTVMLIYGGLLILCFVVPWKLSPDLAFSWDVLEKPNLAATSKLMPLMIGGSGLLGVVLALLPLTVSARGVAAAFLGIVPIGLHSFLLSEISWQGVVGFVGILTLISGLLVRSEYYASLTARIMVTIGVLCALVPFLVPVGDSLPIVELFKEIGTAEGKAKVVPILRITWLFITLLALLAWLPSPSSAGAKILAWIFIFQPFIERLSATLIATEPSALVDTAKASLDTFILLPIVWMAWYALTGYGVASVTGKSLEEAEA